MKMGQKEWFDKLKLYGEIRNIFKRTGDNYLAHAYNYARILFIKKSGSGVRLRVIKL